MYFATVALNKTIIYSCETGGEAVIAERIFADDDKDESLYAVTWAYLPDLGSLCVVGGLAGTIRALNPDTGTTVMALHGHGEYVSELRTCPKDSMLIASVSKDMTARLWRLNHKECLVVIGGHIDGHNDQVLSVDFFGDEYLATSSMDHSIKLWNLREESVSQRIARARNARPGHLGGHVVEMHFPVATALDIHVNYVDCVRFVGSCLFSRASDAIIKQWKFGQLDEGVAGVGNMVTPETLASEIATLNLPHAATWFIKFAVHPANKFLACGSERGDVHVWRLDNGRPTKHSDYVLDGKQHRVYLRDLDFSPGGRVLIAVGDEGRVTRFDLEEQEDTTRVIVDNTDENRTL
ncbi:WD domain-containing protein [Aphelenchoides avenae]|nr:WD domain-containing protein [Aphelenchus avenae]